MLQKKQSKAVWQLKYVLLLPMVLGMLVYTSCETGKDQNQEDIESGVPFTAVKEVPFGMVEEVPIFPGCEDAEDKYACFQEKMQAHIRYNFHYPEEAQEQGIQGRVNTIFRIDPEGNVVDIKMKGPHELLEKETERILSKLPQMKPGKEDGDPVIVPFSIPITFKLSSQDEIAKSVDRNSESIPFAVIDEVPVFPGCEDAEDRSACFTDKVMEHVRKNFRYPEAAQEQGIEGTVSLIFVVGVDGNIAKIRTLGSDEILESEAVRIIERLPKMQPGKHEGNFVNVPFALPITFRLNSQSDEAINQNSGDYIQVSGNYINNNGTILYHGKVTDSESMGLSGVTISLEGKEAGVISNFDGNFAIPVEENEVVKFQYIGLPNKFVRVPKREFLMDLLDKADAENKS